MAKAYTVLWGAHPHTDRRARAIANQAPGKVTSIRTARAADDILCISASSLTEKPHRSAPVRLLRLTVRAEIPSGRTPVGPRHITLVSHRNHQLGRPSRTKTL
ncbi:hypothetical protein GCM10010216_45310 [Streptomyces flaveolus]|nr:hypothetical protein GCM10010216_45310 [Streptomyces flaveolus]